MSDLTGQKVKDTYGRVLQIANANEGADATLREVRDGKGDATALWLSTVEGDLLVKPAGATVARGVRARFGEVFNVKDFGAVGDGVTDDTAAMRAAMAALEASGGGIYCIPAGTYLLTGTIYVPSNATVQGAGRGNTILLADANWPNTLPNQYAFFENKNYDAGTIIDTNITIRDLTLDYGDFGVVNPPNGGQHAIRMWFVRYVTIENVEFQCRDAEDATAFRAVQDGLITGCFAYEARNCPYDHWEECQRCAVVNCYAESPIVAQMVNFNPERTGGPNTDRTARGFILANNHFKSTESSPAPMILAPLGATGRRVEDITVTGNVFENCYLVIRGTVKGCTVIGNVFKGLLPNNSAIEAYALVGQTDPSTGISVIGNVVIDPQTSAGNIGVIRVESDGATVVGNVITGSTYGSVPGIACGTSAVVLTANSVSNNIITAANGRINGAATRIANNLNFGFYDTAGSVLNFRLQSDNNFVMEGTNASGNPRAFLAIAQRSSVSELLFPLPTAFTGTFRVSPTTGIAAAGTNIGGATNLTGNLNVVATCTAGAADGVALNATSGRPQTVINTTADTLKVYPNNSGSAQIDVGGASIPATIAAGKSKTFVQVASNDFRTIAAT
jgi:hypothetical protein